MGYERPPRLRQRGSNGLVGLVTPELDNPIFPAFAQAIEKALTQHKLRAGALHRPPPGGDAPRTSSPSLLVDRGVSGIVFVSGLHADTTARSDRYTRLHRPRPADRAGRRLQPSDVDAPFISPDDRLPRGWPVQHLVDLGHERIGMARSGQPRFVPVIRKIEGYRRAMAQLLGAGDGRTI